MHIDSVGAPNSVLLSGDEAERDPELPWVFPWHQQVIVTPFTYTYQLHRNHVSSHLASSWSNHQWLTTDYDFSFSTPLFICWRNFQVYLWHSLWHLREWCRSQPSHWWCSTGRIFTTSLHLAGPTGAPGIAYIHTDAPKTYHPSPKTAQQLQQLGQINVNSNSHYMAQNPFIVNEEAPASTAHRWLRSHLEFPKSHFFAAIFSLALQSQRQPAWREILIRWGPVICGDIDIARPWSLFIN